RREHTGEEKLDEEIRRAFDLERRLEDEHRAIGGEGKLDAALGALKGTVLNHEAGGLAQAAAAQDRVAEKTVRAEMHRGTETQRDGGVSRQTHEIFRHRAELVFRDRPDARQGKALRIVPELLQHGGDDVDITRFNAHRVSVYAPQLGRT